MKNNNFIFRFSIFFLLFLYLGCSKNVDSFLDRYEKTVEKWEKIAESGNFTLNDLKEINEDNLELSNEAEKLRDDTEWTDSQKKRFNDLTNRLARAISRMSINMKNFNYNY